MRSRVRRILMVAGFVGAGGLVLSGPGTGCSSFTATTGLIATDFCFIFDCQSGVLGGTIDPCGGGESSAGDNLFADCP